MTQVNATLRAPTLAEMIERKELEDESLAKLAPKRREQLLAHRAAAAANPEAWSAHTLPGDVDDEILAGMADASDPIVGIVARASSDVVLPGFRLAVRGVPVRLPGLAIAFARRSIADEMHACYAAHGVDLERAPLVQVPSDEIFNLRLVAKRAGHEFHESGLRLPQLGAFVNATPRMLVRWAITSMRNEDRADYSDGIAQNGGLSKVLLERARRTANQQGQQLGAIEHWWSTRLPPEPSDAEQPAEVIERVFAERAIPVQAPPGPFAEVVAELRELRQLVAAHGLTPPAAAGEREVTK